MSLLSDFKNGDKKALERIYRKYYQRIYLLALHFTKAPVEAEDLVHDIFLKFYNTRARLSDTVTVEAQLVRIARFFILDALKKKKHFLSTDELSLPESQEDPETGEIPDIGKTQQQKLLRAIEQLPARCKEIFTLYKIEGLTRTEIADYKNISVKTVENQISKANKILKKELGTL
ncbi:RNA polymerase sigma factor [Sinomicrobium sp. M5D2P9]